METGWPFSFYLPYNDRLGPETTPGTAEHVVGFAAVKEMS